MPTWQGKEKMQESLGGTQNTSLRSDESSRKEKSVRRQDTALGSQTRLQNFLQNTSEFHEKIGYWISSYHLLLLTYSSKSNEVHLTVTCWENCQHFLCHYKVLMFPTGS